MAFTTTPVALTAGTRAGSGNVIRLATVVANGRTRAMVYGGKRGQHLSTEYCPIGVSKFMRGKKNNTHATDGRGHCSSNTCSQLQVPLAPLVAVCGHWPA